MSHWNCRVVEKTLDSGDKWFGVYEVFYSDEKNIYAITENPVDISGETIEEVKGYFELVKKAFDAPVLKFEEIVFVDDSVSDDKSKIVYNSFDDMIDDILKNE